MALDKIAMYVCLIVFFLALYFGTTSEERPYEQESLASLNYACNDTIPTMAKRKFEKLQALLHEHARYANFRLRFMLDWKCAPTEPY